MTLLAAATLFPLTSKAEDNPFQQAAQDNYSGRFRGADVDLRLWPDGSKWKGNLQFKGTSYTVEAEIKGGQLEGQYADSGQSYSFSGVVEDDKFTFTSGAFSTALSRQKLPKFIGKWGSDKVKIEFEDKKDAEGKLNGKIQFNGSEFTFAAAEKGGDLEGIFKNGLKSYPFRVANELRGIVFETDTFAEKIGRLPYVNSLGMKFVEVPGTDVLFSIWDVRVQDYRAYAEANSSVDESWKNPQYQGVPVTPQETCPVVDVSWNDAKAFCAWLSRKEGKQYRLSTDAEWSVAVGLENETGGTPKDKDGKIPGVYPWGATWPPPNDAGNYDDYNSSAIPGFHDGYPRTSPVGSFAANQFGLYDMGGNVWQWCEDWYDGDQKYRVLRGASWYGGDSGFLLSSYRDGYAPDDRNSNHGFRCVLVAGASAAR